MIDFFMILCYTSCMDCIFDKEKLNQVLSDFHRSTGIAIALYDASEKIVALLPFHSGCCSCIRTNATCLENCDRSNLIHMKEVLNDHTIKRYTCHAGIMETILPIVYEDVVIAYLQIGQFRDAEGIYSSVEKLKETAARYGFDLDQLLPLYENLPCVSEEKLNALCNILEILIKSFWRDGLISYQRSMLSVKIEQYISDHLTEKIYIDDLCEKFGLSKNALYQLFHDEFHTTVGEYIIEKRLHLAQEYLQTESKINITQIAALCGFPDYNYFIRLFKKQVGKTPLQFRKGINSKIY